MCVAVLLKVVATVLQNRINQILLLAELKKSLGTAVLFFCSAIHEGAIRSHEGRKRELAIVRSSFLMFYGLLRCEAGLHPDGRAAGDDFCAFSFLHVGHTFECHMPIVHGTVQDKTLV